MHPLPSFRAKVESFGDAVEQIASWHRWTARARRRRRVCCHEVQHCTCARANDCPIVLPLCRRAMWLCSCSTATNRLVHTISVSNRLRLGCRGMKSSDWRVCLQGVVRQQDLALMQVAIDKGKPVMFAINKTDCIPAAERGPILRHLMKQLSESISQVACVLARCEMNGNACAVGRHYHR